MDVTIDIQHEDEDTVQFIKHLEENLDPDDEYTGSVSLETVATDEVDFDEVPGSEIPTGRLDDPVFRATGVRFEFALEGDQPFDKWGLSDVIDTFYGEDSYVLYAGYRGGDDRYYGYIFEEQ